MKSKLFRFLEGFHKTYKTLGNILTWGGFLFLVVGITILQGFPGGFLLGLFIGSIFAFISWLGFKKSYNDAVEAREKFFAYSQGNKEVFSKSNQVGYSILGIIIIGVLGLLLLASCSIYSCKSDLVRPRIIFILIGLGITIEQLFYKERVKGKSALITLGVIASLVIFLLGRVFSLW